MTNRILLAAFGVTLPTGLALAAGAADKSDKAFLGKWSFCPNDGGSFAYHLDLRKEGTAWKGAFLNRGGSPVELADAKVENGQLLIWTKGKAPPDPARPFGRLEPAGGKLAGTFGEGKVAVTGERPPVWKKANANGKHRLGKAVALFDGKSLDAWTGQDPKKALMWNIKDGVMTNESHGNNLVSKEKWKDFKIEAEYNITPKGNSGIYLRGRYELQVLDDHGKPPESHGHMSIYGRVPPKENASKPAGEWQAMEAVVVGNRVTVKLNGKLLHDNAELPAITGGALDCHEAEAGPILIQGDHEVVSFRKIVVTPILAK
jgi:hypothetical protein